MGEVGVGLAHSLVEGVLTTVYSAAGQVRNLRQRMVRDLVFISGEFQMMDSFLKVANEDEAASAVVKTWVMQIRDLAYDVEDCVDFVISLDDSSTSWWWRMVPSCTVPMRPLDVAASELEQLKKRVEDVATRQSRYSLIADSSSADTKTRTKKTSNGTAATALDMLNEAREATKRQGFADLTQLMTQKDDDDDDDDDGHHIITVWGTGGDLGTTSAMRKPYSDPKFFQKFACRAWVKLVHLFNPQEFIQELAAQFYASSEELNAETIRGFLTISEGATHADYLDEFLQHVKEVKYLIVLEDLSTMAQWGVIRKILPDTNNGSRIIVSTQQFEVATLCLGHPLQALELKQFSTDHSVCAFTECSQGNGENSEEITETHEVPEMVLTSKTNAANDWMMKYPIIGRELEIRQLYQYTTDARRLGFPVISVWGIAGVGKSALVKDLFCNRIMSSRLFQNYGWVDVSHPFNLRNFCGSLILDLYSESLQVKGRIDIKNPIQECSDFLEQHHCLLVIDDLHSREEWDLIKSAFLSKSSRSIVIVITTKESIATYCADSEELVFNVKGLQAIPAFDLFLQEVNRKNPFSPLKDLKEDIKLLELIVKCGGLPKVIVEIAGVLADKTITLVDTICSTSDRFIHTLETKPEYHTLYGLFGWLHSYLRTCPDSLKPCIFYISLFHRDQSIRRRRVLRRWVAEGYCRETEERSAENEGEMFFAKLVDLSIIQHPPLSATALFGGTRMTLCEVNSFFREFIISRRMEENLVCELDTSCNVTTQRTGRHLIIRESWDRNKDVFGSIDFSRLRSMTVFGGWKSFFISKSMKLLRVLDLEDASGVKDEDLKNMVKLLSRLKFLSLRGCRDVYSLPSSLGDLRQLQTLDIRNTPIVSLPATITKLQKLQYIRAGTSSDTGEELSTPPRILLSRIRRRHSLVGVEVPRGIYKLTQLHTFGVVNIGDSGRTTILKDIKHLTQLRKLGVSGVNRQNSIRFFSAISDHVHLESLSVQLDKESQGCLADISIPWMRLQSLKLHGPVDSLPVLQQLRSLTKLDLEMTILESADIELIGDLLRLCILCVKLQQADSRLHFCVSRNGFQALKVLEVASTSNVHVTYGAETMENLELLKAHCRNGSSINFSGLYNLVGLKEVLLKGCCDDGLKEEVQNQLLLLPNLPVLKLEE